MENRIDLLFERKPTGIVSIFLTAGFPSPGDTVNICKSIINAGADMIEIGMPFSDPIADGPIIQQSSMVALDHGMNIDSLLEQAKEVRSSTNAPLILMGYLNPVLQYGFERCITKLAAHGIDGVIIPDLPPEEYERSYRDIFEKSGIYNILLIAPNTTETRIRYLDSISKGFLYVVSSLSITGGTLKSDGARKTYLQRLKEMKLKKPLIVGFGIKSKTDLSHIHEYAAGGIVGSAFIEALTHSQNPTQTAEKFMRTLI